MLRQLAVSGALFVGASIPAGVQQREATLQRIEIPAAPFDLLIAAPMPAGVIFDLAEAPDALLLNLAGRELALGFEHADAMLRTLELVRTPVCSFGGQGRTAITIYTVPKPE